MHALDTVDSGQYISPAFATEKLKVWCAVKAVCMGLQGIHSFLVQFYDTTFSFFCIFFTFVGNIYYFDVLCFVGSYF